MSCSHVENPTQDLKPEKKEEKINKMAPKKVIFIALLFFLGALILRAQQTFNTTIYFDYTFNVTDDGYKTASQKNLNNLFTFRRAYFTYENKISDRLKFRFRYDADYVKAVDASGKKDDKQRPFIKHLYVDYSGLLPNSSLKIGMTETLTFKLAEDRWGYRSVAKTLLDGYKDITGTEIDASSADIGASLTGSLAKQVRYGFMVENGAGYSHPEGDKYKKVAANLHFIPAAGLSLVGYVDYEKQTPSDRAYTYKLDAYLEMIKGLTLGGEWFTYDNSTYKKADLTHYNVSGYSFFGRLVAVRDKVNLFARFDRYEPNSKIDKDEINLLITGFDWIPVSSTWRIQPNIWYYSYADTTRKNDVVFNFTFFLSF